MINAIQQVGFIGLGDQGAPMARAIAQKHVLHVWARHPESYKALPSVGHFTAVSGQFAKLCNNALTVSNLRDVVEVFAMADKVGINLRALQAAFEHSGGGSFVLQARISAETAEHLAELNRADIREFDDAMEARGADPRPVLEWAIKGPDALPDLVELITDFSGSALCPPGGEARPSESPDVDQRHSPFGTWPECNP